jgi:hypothetical protein
MRSWLCILLFSCTSSEKAYDKSLVSFNAWSMDVMLAFSSLMVVMVLSSVCETSIYDRAAFEHTFNADIFSLGAEPCLGCTIVFTLAVDHCGVLAQREALGRA